LALNGVALAANDADCVSAVLGVADGTMSDTAFAAWIRGNLIEAR
jgi:prophage maintenance system killer protein